MGKKGKGLNESKILEKNMVRMAPTNTQIRYGEGGKTKSGNAYKTIGGTGKGPEKINGSGKLHTSRKEKN